ncbi:amino acid ABC transporter substrate-binding protein [Vulcanibacillus modesticaldus]|uniref:Amino acid ABC transporter substrate-binding protein n=1 Tax=Vulcanibacillus modesticaldus TaxID=337097 RepID=A0A1D2YW81_9BACI|nr:amino acid ABC transporter substrate-binding protein [Vulcanibacillus modesticaldus]OEF99959.1 amino acid ABC transporter substrate-binding protein [Vulcanibacillus modesticaldus]
MKKKSILLLLLGLILVFSFALTGCGSKETNDQPTTTNSSDSSDASSANSSAPTKISTLEKVKNRGKVIVGVNGKLPGFGYVDSNGKYTGFDVDFARALAAAIFNDPDAVEFRPLSAQERFTALQTGEIDVLIRNTTWTISRDTQLGTNFAPTTFYDGQGIMVRKDSGINSLKDLEGARIGVETGTTTELNLADQFRKLGIKYEPVVFEDSNAMVAAYEKGSLDAWTTDKSGLVSRQSTLSDPSAHKILKETLSKEPLGPVVLHGDDQWFDIVKWVVFATIEAEELGITQDNIDSFMNSDDPVVRRFLGVDGDLGEQLGLTKDFAVRVIKAVGNYGEIYNRHLGPDTIFNMDRGLNDLWTNGGLLYSPPFR